MLHVNCGESAVGRERMDLTTAAGAEVCRMWIAVTGVKYTHCTKS